MKEISIFSAIAALMMATVSLTSCNKSDNNSPAEDDTYTVMLTKGRIDGQYHYQLGSFSGCKIETSAGAYSYYPWEMSEELADNPCGRLSVGYTDVNADASTEVTITTSIPSTMQTVTTGGDEVSPLIVNKKDDKNWTVSYNVNGPGYGAGYVLITGENGVTKLVSLGAHGILPVVTENFGSSISYVIGKSSAGAAAATREDALKAPVVMTMGDSLIVKSFTHSYIPNYDIRNTVDVVENVNCPTAPKASLSAPVCLTNFSGLKVMPQDTGKFVISLSCRRPDGSAGVTEKQCFAFYVKEDK